MKNQATETKTNLSSNILKMLPKTPNKSNLYSMNKMAINVFCMAAAPVGILLLFAFLSTFDGIANSFSISELIGERMSGFIAAVKDITHEAAKSVARVWATYISLFCSIALGMGIFITSLLGKKTRAVSIRLTIMSAMISFVGFEMFVIPKDKPIIETILNAFFWIQTLFALFLAVFPAYTMYFLAEYLRDTYGSLIDHFNMQITERVVNDNKKELVDQKQEDEQGNGMGKQNPFSAGNVFGNMGSFANQAS